MKTYTLNLLFSISLMLNAIAGGVRFETLSARAYAMKVRGRVWLALIIDTALGRDHCKRAFEAKK